MNARLRIQDKIDEAKQHLEELEDLRDDKEAWLSFYKEHGKDVCYDETKALINALDFAIDFINCVPQWTLRETTTFKPIATDTRGYACQFRCNVCGCTVSTAYYMRPDQFDYNCCPYCNRPVESEDDAE